MDCAVTKSGRKVHIFCRSEGMQPVSGMMSFAYSIFLLEEPLAIYCDLLQSYDNVLAIKLQVGTERRDMFTVPQRRS